MLALLATLLISPSHCDTASHVAAPVVKLTLTSTDPARFPHLPTNRKSGGPFFKGLDEESEVDENFIACGSLQVCLEWPLRIGIAQSAPASPPREPAGCIAATRLKC